MAIKRANTPRSSPAVDLASLTDRELLLFVHQDLCAKIKSSEAAVLEEVDGLRHAVQDLAPLAGKVDALIKDVRDLDAAKQKAQAELKLAHGRIVDLEANGVRRAGRSR
jgi:hypothetical protein